MFPLQLPLLLPEEVGRGLSSGVRPRSGDRGLPPANCRGLDSNSLLSPRGTQRGEGARQGRGGREVPQLFAGLLDEFLGEVGILDPPVEFLEEGLWKNDGRLLYCTTNAG